ncbi:MAG: glycosyltransferase family 4 protein [Pyrinomonadaceae bacterium]
MRILLLNQCFYPDVVSTAQHLTDLAVALATDGHEVTVVASRRGYDKPDVRFRAREHWRGINIIRIPTLGLGKKARWRRAADFASFLVACAGQLLLLPRQDAIVALTSPPLISFFGALFARLKGGKFYFWIMDLNPDEAIAAGWLKENSLASKVLQALLAYSLRRAEKIFVLDRFMEERVRAKGIAGTRLLVVPPWSHDEAIKYDEAARTKFRVAHGLADKYVVMYSGNHSPCHPLDTLLQAAERLSARTDIVFCFVGGGSEHKKVQEFVAKRALKNVKCLPYQPLTELSASLSAADLHIVVMGEPFRGIVHPCKIYNILGLGLPLLYIGPAESHITDITGRLDNYSYEAKHGEVDRVVAHVLARAAQGAQRSHDAVSIAAEYSRKRLLPRMVLPLSEVKVSIEEAVPAPKPQTL